MEWHELTIVVFTLLLALVNRNFGSSQSWRPIVPKHLTTSILRQDAHGYDSALYNIPDSSRPQSPLLLHNDRDQCALYKVSMDQQLYFQVSYSLLKNLKYTRY